MRKDSASHESDLRRLILDTTRHLLVQDGYSSLSMRKIAREIDYSATSIYLCFDSKDALFQSLIDEGMQQLYEALQEAHASHLHQPVARLEAMARQYIQFGLENSEYYEIMFILHPDHVARFPADKYRRARRNLDLFASALEDATARGALQVDDPRVAASSMWATLHGTVALLLARRIDASIEQETFVQRTVAHALDGFKKAPPAFSQPSSKKT